MSKQNNVEFLNKMIENTKERKITWKYLDENWELYEGMEWTKSTQDFDAFFHAKEKIVPDFDSENSFYAHIGEMYIVLLVRYKQPANFYVVPKTYKKVVRMSSEEYGEHITRLLNLVHSQFPNASDFIDKFVNQDKN